MESALKTIYRGFLFPLLRILSHFFRRFTQRGSQITMPPVDLHAATSREEMLTLCRSAYIDQPPLLSRSFVKVSDTPPDSTERTLRLMNWNALADALCNGTENFIRCPSECLQWSLRRYRCLEEILTYDPDVLCLQEIDHYADFFQPLLAKVGYAGSFNPKPDSPCLDCLNNSGPDGCALFYKESKFELLEGKCPILEVQNGGRAYKTNQVAILDKLRFREGSRTLVVGTTHLKAKIGWESLRLKQGCNLIDVAKTLGEKGPVIIGGDYNAEAHEPVYKAFASEFQSAYKLLDGGNSEPPYTTWKIRPRGEMCHTIDYIWHSRDTVVPVSLLKLPTADQIGEGRLPSWEYPSDHLSLVCDLVLSEV